MKVLITGGTGQLGRELLDTVPAQLCAIAPPRVELDLLDRTSIEKTVVAHQPDVIINTAAYTHVDQAEADRDAAFALNATAAGFLAAAAKSQEAKLIQISTDFVFGGKSKAPRQSADSTEPLGVYGASKLDGEKQVSKIAASRAVILRTAWLYSQHGNNFVQSMIGLMAEKPEIRIVSDQIGTPTWTRSLTRAIWRAVELPDLIGIHHWTDAGQASWHEFAVAIQEEALAVGLLSQKIPIHQVATADYPTPAARPAYSVLDKTATIQALSIEPVPWRDALREMLEQLAATRGKTAQRQASNG